MMDDLLANLDAGLINQTRHSDLEENKQQEIVSERKLWYEREIQSAEGNEDLAEFKKAMSISNSKFKRSQSIF